MTLRMMTIEEFESFADSPENAERRFELIDGEIVEKVPTELHGVITAYLAAWLVVFVQQNDLGRIAVEPRHRTLEDNHNSRIPDIAFTRKERALPITTRGSVPQMPDLAIEIKSPTDSYNQLRDKAEYYLQNGVLMVWLVFPEKHMIEVYRVGEDVEILLENDTLSGYNLLPGFSIAVQEIFPV